MILRVLILFCCLLYSLADHRGSSPKCLMGVMTDVQSWVDGNGNLHPSKAEVPNSIDLSANQNPVPALYQKMNTFITQRYSVKYLSMARCELTRVPPIFQMRDPQGRALAQTLEYLSFYGNSFWGMRSTVQQYSVNFNATGSTEMSLTDSPQIQKSIVWSASFTPHNFSNLRELDLRACSIQILGESLFRGMSNLTALYIGENQICSIDSTAFFGLKNLIHLDFSRNQGYDENGNPKNLATDSYYVFKNLETLESLDLSHTRLTQINLGMLRGLGKSLKSLSMCDTGLNSLQDGIFNGTSLQLLDVSWNSGILTFHNALQGLENSLMILYAQDIALQTMDIFKNFAKLKILQLSYNEISNVSDSVVKTLYRLLILDLDKNRLTSWFDHTYSLIPKLRYLSLQNNNINIITEEMIEDLMYVDYLALAGNFFVCNCHAKDLYKKSARNEMNYNDTLLKIPKNPMYQHGYTYYNDIISRRNPSELEDCDEKCYNEIGDSGSVRLVDYSPTTYVCLMLSESRSVLISNVTSCSRESREIDYDDELAAGRKKLLALLVIPCILLPVAVIFVFRRHVRYFFITMRNSAMLSLINKKDIIDDDTIFNYDVFVSYCNEDRGWVLDHLLPHIEAECSISACLHERDFQVGLSILENIVSCMDRSKSIMLIISQRFLLSQWCQFEMHLAQHRLLETRREDLTLVLLEDIPRRLRPNTLHYLMLTKTYIVWPKEEAERTLFWRRINKTLTSQKTKQIENVSLA